MTLKVDQPNTSLVYKSIKQSINLSKQLLQGPQSDRRRETVKRYDRRIGAREYGKCILAVANVSRDGEEVMSESKSFHIHAPAPGKA